MVGWGEIGEGEKIARWERAGEKICAGAGTAACAGAAVAVFSDDSAMVQERSVRDGRRVGEVRS